MAGDAQPSSRRRVLRYGAAALSVAISAVLASGCGPAGGESADAEVELVSLDPSPPVVGDCQVVLKLSDSSGAPLEGADVELEGNMNHAGMKPSFATLEEVDPGTYSGTLDFTMGGDWFLLVTGQTPDGQRVEQKIDVPGVKAN